MLTLKTYQNKKLTVIEAAYSTGRARKYLELAIMGREFKVSEMYLTYIEVARQQSGKVVELRFR